MKKARIIYNPTAGREGFKRELPDVLARFEKAGYETSAHATTKAGDAIHAAKYAIEHRFDMIIVAGGDGTINEVINGMAPEDYRPKLGIIPSGTTNDFARALKIPRQTNKAVDVILENESMLLDIGKVNGQYFMNIAGGGDLTELTYEVPSGLKAAIGQLAYYMKGVEMLPFIRPTRTRIEYDGEVIDEEVMLFLVANTNSVGGFERLAPEAKVNDGYFDLLILRATNLAELLRVATLAIRGAHIQDDLIIYTKAKHIKVQPDSRMQLNIDGEYGGLLPGEFINYKQHIEYIVPKKIIETQKDST